MRFLKITILNLLLVISAGLLAQSSFQDNFSDGDFTNNPSWFGDITKYIVIGANNELRINDLGNSGSAALYVPLNLRDSVSWEFLVKTDLTTAGPSSTNRIRIYLQSNTSDFTAPSLNGYFLQIGETGSLDALEIYRVTNGSSTRILRGTDATVAGAVINSRIRIIRNNFGVWELFADHSGGTNFISEGTVTDNTHNVGSFFAVFTTYTTTQGERFFYDDFLISPLFVDLVPPVALSATAIDANTVDVLFDEPVDLNSAQLATNYNINNGINIISATRDAVNTALVHLSVSTLTNLSSYQLTASNVSDLANNSMGSQNLNFSYIQVVIPTFQDIIFNEIMIDPNPVVNLPDAEFVELHNRSSAAINLGSCTFTHRSTSGAETQRTLGTYLLMPGEYVILHNDNAFLSYPNNLQIPSFTALNNTSAYLILKTASGDIIDSILYDISWYRDPVKDDGGWSLELMNPNELCKAGNNWIASIDPDGGTPGSENSVFNNVQDLSPPLIVTTNQLSTDQALITFNEALDPISAIITTNYTINGALNILTAVLLNDRTVQLTFDVNMSNNFTYIININNVGDCLGNSSALQGQFTYVLIQPANFQDIIFNEIMIDPTPVLNLPDAEFVELYNRSNAAIDLTGYTFSHRSSTSSTTSSVTLGAYILMPGEFLIVHNSTDYESANNDLRVGSFPALNNSSAFLILRDANGDVIDSLLYSSDWYQDNLKDDGGWTLELINPNLICKGGVNWIASNSPDGGTPGSPNSVLDNSLDTLAPSAVLARQSSVNQIIITFDDVLDANSAINPAHYSVSGALNVIFAELLDERTVELTFNANMTAAVIYTIAIDGVADCIGNTDTMNVSFEYYLISEATHYDIIINEIFSDPNPVVGLPEKEFVELYNRSNKNINLEGFTFSDGTSSVANFPFYILKPAQYLIIYKNGEPDYQSFGDVLEFDVFPDLDVSADELVLRNRFGNVIDAVEYELSWYGSSAKSEGGWTLERINPNRPCEGRENWAASVAQPPAYPTIGGTPGQANSVLQTIPDLTGPDILRAYPFAAQITTNGDSIRLSFSEAVGDSSAVNISNYAINNGINVVEACIEPPFYNTVVIITDQALVLGTTYTLTLNSGLTDCIGNPVGLNNTVEFAKPEPIYAGDIIINEILFNPVTGGVDYLELYNKTNKVLNVGDLWISNTSGWQLLDANDVKIDYLLFPQQYVVLTSSPFQVEETYRTGDPLKTPDLNKMVLFSLPSFPDNEGTCVVYTINNTFAEFVDSFTYNKDMHNRLIDDQNGVALERIDFYAPSNDRNNWHSGAQAVKFGTPTYRNSSAYSNEITDDGVIQLPNNTFSPDADGFEDFLLINYNIDDNGFVGNITIYDAHGRFVRKLVSNELLMREGTILWDGSNEDGEKCIVGPYIIFAEIFSPDGRVKRYKKTCILAAKFNR